ncbi:MAG: aminopeptidase [Oscillospiraceae bacterium]|jgi:aminopeptidase|nr:aminopeptidase [Oscillospiraceae bacterium]
MEAKFKEYAKLLVEVGVNIQKGQTLVIGSPVDCAWFARLCARAAYAAGCREVVMRWSDDELTREKYLHAEDSVFDSLPAWQAEFDNGYARQGAAFLHISARDPENLVGVDPDRITRSQRSSGEALREYRELTMSNTVPWCIGSIPIPSWARKVFPGCPEDEAVEKLWEAIFQTVRVDGSGAAVDRWREHLAGLKGHMDRLNGLNLESLHYTNSLGTDLTIRLPEGHIWAAGSSATKSGLPFIANMPTEEVFTAPLRNGVDGVVCSSMPLVHNGVVIDKIRFQVREGKIVEASAQTGEDALKAAITLDEGASCFGEVALVPYDSPISRQKLLYYNTLFDENASCHLAFGEAYPECLQGGAEMSKEERKARGLNDSITHVDFMVGTADLSVTGKTRDGREVPVFVDGNFAW